MFIHYTWRFVYKRALDRANRGGNRQWRVNVVVVDLRLGPALALTLFYSLLAVQGLAL